MNFRFQTAVATLVLALASLQPAAAQQTKQQQGCIAHLSKGAAAISAKQLKTIASCVKSYANDPMAPDVDACLTASTAVSDAQAKLLAGEPGKCPVIPTIGPDSAAQVAGEAANVPLYLISDLLGSFTTDLVKCSDAPQEDGCKCQDTILKTVVRYWNFYVKSSNKCMTSGLKAEGAEQIVDTAAVLECIVNPAEFDPGAKLAKLQTKSKEAIAKGCAPSVTNPLPQSFHCSGLTGDALATCLDAEVRCETCVMLNYLDSVDSYASCEIFDDGLDNGSCHGI